MSKKVLVIGDPHFKTSNEFETTQLFNIVEHFLKNCEVSYIIVLGDICDTHERVDIRPLKRATEFLIMLTKYHPTFVLIGNHDRVNNSDYLSPVHVLSTLELLPIPNLTIVSKPIIFDDMCLCPYVPNNRFKEALATIGISGAPGEGIRIIFAHQEIKGAQMGAIVSTIDETWPSENIPVISGHIHDYQKVGLNWTYVGTPFCHNYGSNSRKTVSLWEWGGDGNEVLISIPKETRLDLHLPMKKTEHLAVEDIYKRSDWQPEDNVLYKWRIKGLKGEIQKLIKSGALNPLKERARIKIEFEFVESEQTPTTHKIFRNYLDILNERVTEPLVQSYLQALVSGALK